MTGAALLRGGRVVDGTGREPQPADVAVRDGRVVAVGPDAVAAAEPGCAVLDCAGRLVLPGFVDTHSHADAAVLDPAVQHALLAQGTTTVIAGQDGVSYAPGDGGYAGRYFGGLDGVHPGYSGGGVGKLLAGYDGETAVNVGYLVPAGTVRFEVLGWADRPATAAEIAAMRELVADGLADGALGVSTGLDYVPGRFADTAEIAAICRPLADRGGVYVSHARGYESAIGPGIAEVVEVGRRAGGVPVHVSHLHAPPELAFAALEQAGRVGADLTFDTYPYRAGCSLLAMPLLPAELLARAPELVLAELADPAVRGRLERDLVARAAAVPSLGAGWADRLTIADPGAAAYSWAGGLSLATAATRAGRPVGAFALDLLTASGLQATVVMGYPPGRSVDDIAALIRHPGQLGGSDGIYLGSHPHPRAWGTMSRFLARHVRERGDLTIGQAGWHFAGHPARRFGLPDRGFVRPGMVADLIVLDPVRVADTATYADPRRLSVGIDDVLVAGRFVLRAGELTGDLPGRGLRRAGTAPAGAGGVSGAG